MGRGEGGEWEGEGEKQGGRVIIWVAKLERCLTKFDGWMAKQKVEWVAEKVEEGSVERWVAMY